MAMELCGSRPGAVFLYLTFGMTNPGWGWRRPRRADGTADWAVEPCSGGETVRLLLFPMRAGCQPGKELTAEG